MAEGAEMRDLKVRNVLLGTTLVLMCVAGTQPASAVHWYRGTASGCTPADGALSDDPVGTVPNVVATVALGHNSFGEGVFGFDAQGLVAPPETRIKVGETIRWTWNSAHCHSVTSAAFTAPQQRLFHSGYHYPASTPESTRAVPGVFDYPMLDATPTLSYTRTFTMPGTYSYSCVHHESIGMRGVVVVEAT